MGKPSWYIMSDPIPVTHIHNHLIIGMTRCACHPEGLSLIIYRVDQAGVNARQPRLCLLKATSPGILTGGSSPVTFPLSKS